MEVFAFSILPIAAPPASLILLLSKNTRTTVLLAVNPSANAVAAKSPSEFSCKYNAVKVELVLRLRPKDVPAYSTEVMTSLLSAHQHKTSRGEVLSREGSIMVVKHIMAELLR